MTARNILLLQLRRLGDLILTTPAIEAFRAAIPEARISIAVAQSSAPLLPAIAGLDQTIVAGRSAWREIRRGHFDCVIDLTRNDRSAFLTAISGASRRLVSHRLRRQSRLRALFYNEFPECVMKEMHTADYYLALLRPLGLRRASARPRLDLPAPAKDEAEKIVAEQMEGGPFVIFHPGSARAEKFWEPARWAETIDSLPEELLPVLSGAAGEIEEQHLASIRAQLCRPFLDLSGRIDLLTLAALIARARLLVTVDSAPVHLAAASRTPQVALFGPTNPFHWRPRHSPVAILFGTNPQPLTEFRYAEPRKPMTDISTAAVIDAIHSQLSAPAGSAV